MAAPTPEAIETARRKVQQAKARLQALEARAATMNRKADARRKIILGGLLLDAAMKDPAWESRLNDLMNRISRDQDRKAVEGWTFKGGPAAARSLRPCRVRRAPSRRSRRGLSHPARRHAEGRGRRGRPAGRRPVPPDGA